ncbi:OLC1v1033847C1 [Oldenlandia corymbosa var. corymbosa]|uniref:OLC1v1033847C1 n=1 Tax=Oldenlandia corymbosa var. corymbosa TaxID=529605 RepID=A0AAV1CPB4_OLDCO|nr:OLC1v1033847C1 [Oldenlandia corymbosa var. corymbosa]
MAKPNGIADNHIKSEHQVEMTEEKQDKGEEDSKWGTWEELLLACAVNRYGTNNWESVAAEIQKRSSIPNPLLLTPGSCRKKYLHLTRRFFTRNRLLVGDNKSDCSDGAGAGAGSGDVDGDIVATDKSVPLLEELRKLRVAELRREVERYDLSIVSLQSKVERMKEDRERSNSEKGEKKSSDLFSKSVKADAKSDRIESEVMGDVKEEPDKSPLSVAGEPVSDKDEQSANDDRVTDRRINDENAGREGNMEEGAKESDRTGEGKETEPAGVEKPVREEDSCYGSSDSVEKEDPELVQQKVKIEPESVSDSPELVESVAESKEDGGGGGGGKEEEAATTTAKEDCSDVQSSATKSREDGDSHQLPRGSCDVEKKCKSPAVKIEGSIECQPLIDFLEDLKRHKLGLVFSRRLDSQETSNYKNMIRQHIDLETVHTRVKEGAYSDSHLKFFRDLLLLVNNAMVFFGKTSTEFVAATKLRDLISSKMTQKIAAKSDSSSDKQSSLQRTSSLSLLPKKENSEQSESLLLKPKLGGPLIFCRKRSSIAAKASGTASSSGSDKKKEQTTSKLGEEKGVPDSKQLFKTEEPRITKKRSRDRFSSVTINNVKKNGKNAVTGNNPSSKQISEKSQVKGAGSSLQQLELPKSENKSKNSNTDPKKRSAATFLNRMKQSSSSKNNGASLDAIKSSSLTKGGGSEPKKNETGKSSGKKEQASSTRVTSEAKSTKEKGTASSPVKKSLGRPPKKGGPATPPPVTGKRNRGDGKESESVATNHKRKRSRK